MNITTKTSLNAADFVTLKSEDSDRSVVSLWWERFKEPVSDMLRVSTRFTPNMENSSVKQEEQL